MIDADALDAIRCGRPGVHISFNGQPLEATDVIANGNTLFVTTRHMDGSAGPTVPAAQATALRRSYDKGDE